MIFYSLYDNGVPVLMIQSTNKQEIEEYFEQPINKDRTCILEATDYKDISYESKLVGIAHWEISIGDPSAYQLVLDRRYRNTGIRNILAGITRDTAGYSYYTTQLGQFNLFSQDGASQHKNCQAGYLHNTEISAAFAHVEDLVMTNIKNLRMQADSLLCKIEEHCMPESYSEI